MQGDFTKIVPCGKCVLCLKRRQNAWAFRLSEEAKISTSAAFITLTYEEAPLSFNGHPTLDKTHYQKFMKRLRKTIKNSNIKYYACGEYGSLTERPHYHAIMFNLPQKWLVQSEHLHTVWGQGHIDISPCNTATIRYVTKYLMKGRHEPKTDCDDRSPQFSLMSKKMGLSHLTPEMVKYYTENLISHVTLSGGTLTSLPRYFRDKIFSKEEKKLINAETQLFRETNFKKLFNDCFKQELTWKKDQTRKDEKLQRLERQKI
jgi:hypothetical protein